MVGYTYDDKPVTAHDLKAEGAMAALLKDALKPNLVQTLGIPRLSSTAVRSPTSPTAATPSWPRRPWAGDYCVTEAGFGADWARRSSWISSAASRVLSPTRWWSWPRCGR